MNTYVSVFSARRIANAGRVDGDRVQGTEVAPDTADLVLEYLVVESGLKLSLSGGGGSHIHGSLATTEHDEVLLCRYGCSVERCIGSVGLEDFEGT